MTNRQIKAQGTKPDDLICFDLTYIDFLMGIAAHTRTISAIVCYELKPIEDRQMIGTKKPALKAGNKKADTMIGFYYLFKFKV